MAATLRAAVLPYKSTFVSSELSMVSLRQDFDDGSHTKKSCPVFSGEHGIEALFYVEERFRKLAERNFMWAGDGADLFANFEEVLVDTALTNWEDIIDPIADPDKTDVRFDAAVQEMYRKYVGAEARDTQLEYFKTLRKPMKTDPLTHSSRMLTLARYGNRLPGTDPGLSELQIKKCIFHSFPQSWQQQFVRTGQHVATTQLSDIIEFMSNEKSFADAKTSTSTEGKKNSDADGTRDRKRKKTNGHAGRNGGRGKRVNFTPPSADETCRIHGGHTWGNCYNNPRGVNANKPRAENGRGRGGCGEASKAEETATAVEEMEVETMASIILNLRRQKPLQSRDSKEHQQKRGPRGTQLSSITLTLLDKVPNTDGNPALGIQVNIKLHKQLHCLDNRKVFLFVNYKQKINQTFFHLCQFVLDLLSESKQWKNLSSQTMTTANQSRKLTCFWTTFLNLTRSSNSHHKWCQNSSRETDLQMSFRAPLQS
jgi:hypothetical protein